MFEGVALSHAPAPHGFEHWTFKVLQRGPGAVSNPIVIRLNVGPGASCGLSGRPIAGQRYRVEATGRSGEVLPDITLCSGALVPLAAGEDAFPTLNDGAGAAGWPTMLAALGAFLALLALAQATRRAP